jgi:hypothetical protein
MPVPLFASRPDRCPFGHSLTAGAPQRIGWKPCLCAAAREGAALGVGMGHLWIWCIACDDEGREAMFYEPPHDIAHREPGAWQPPRPPLDGLIVLSHLSTTL